MDFENIPDELKAKAKECASPEELLALAKAKGYELSEEDLAAVSGGKDWTCTDEACPAQGRCAAGASSLTVDAKAIM